MDFYFDENLPVRIANALAALEEGENHNVYHTTLAFEPSIKDPDLYPLIRNRNGILVTNDMKMLSRAPEYQIMLTLQITAFFISLPKGADFALRYRTIFDKWEDIKLICRKNKRPFMCRIKMRGKPEIWDHF
jgi:hypothetical protein